MATLDVSTQAVMSLPQAPCHRIGAMAGPAVLANFCWQAELFCRKEKSLDIQALQGFLSVRSGFRKLP
jgi:hypothetical protein